MIVQQLQQLPLHVAILQITIRPEDTIRLGLYPAMTLRGGIGYALRNVACSCEGKKHENQCLYTKLYEEREGAYLGTLYIPYVRPFIIRTGENKQFTYSAEESYTFEIVLFGEAIQHADTFILAMKLFGQKGLGEEKKHFTVERVVEKRPFKSIILYEHEVLIAKAKGYNPFELLTVPVAPTKLQLRLLTPLRLQVEGSYLSNVPVEAFIDNLLRRIRSVMYFHQGGYLLGQDLTEQLLEYAYNGTVIQEQYQYKAYKRFSTRQKKQMPMDGITGKLTIKNVTPLVTMFLEGCKELHTGKQTVFGFGQYEINYYEA